MVNRCAIKSCKNSSRFKSKLLSNVSFHRLPLNLNKCNDWLEKCRIGHVIGNTSKIESLRLCSRHFQPNCYGANGKLTMDATPTIFDWEQSTNLEPFYLTSTKSSTITESIASTSKSDINTDNFIRVIICKHINACAQEFNEAVDDCRNNFNHKANVVEQQMLLEMNATPIIVNENQKIQNQAKLILGLSQNKFNDQNREKIEIKMAKVIDLMNDDGKK